MLQTNNTGVRSQCLNHTGSPPAHGTCSLPFHTARALGCLEGMIVRLKLQYFGHLMRRVDSLEKALMLGGIGGRRRRGRQRMRWLDGITDSMDVGLRIQNHCRW